MEAGMQEETKFCEHCGAEEASYVINPYDQDVNNIEVWQWICDDCYEAFCGDI
jgi:hypothetical protein